MATKVCWEDVGEVICAGLFIFILIFAFTGKTRAQVALIDPPRSLYADSTMVHWLPAPTYKLKADSLFELENPIDAYPVYADDPPAREWRFIGIVTFADTAIFRYEGESVERYWR